MGMKHTLISAGTALLAAALLQAQVASPAPAPVPAPAPPRPVVDFDIDIDLPDFSHLQTEMEARRVEMEARGAEMAARAAEMAVNLKGIAPMFGSEPFFKGRHDSVERLYDRGQRALDGRRWDEALDYFSQVVARGGARADAGLYWKAYTLNKLGRRDEALAALAELRKAHAQSRWLDDAKALEIEVKQAAGQPVKPESQDDEELKLMAINGIMETDTERAIPLLENLLKGSQSPKLKERTLFVLAQSDSPRARQVIEQVARGGTGNPDLQLKAILLLSARNKKSGDSGPLLWEIYRSTNSVEVKERILHSLVAGGNFERLLEVARTEKDPKLRRTAIYSLSSMKSVQTGDSLTSLYGGESDQEVKKAIINALGGQRNAKALVTLARRENDPQMKREIVARLTGMKSKEASDYLMELIR
jgi:HEAT repeat protein